MTGGKNMMITSRFEIAGKKVKKEIGIVSGSAVMSRNFIRDFFAGIRNFLGHELKEYSEMIDKSKAVAMERMIEKAEEMGANAIMGVRLTTAEVAHGAGEIIVYGTAVVIE